MASKSEVVKKTESAVVTFSYDGFEGAGFENQGASDVTIPFLGVLQALSPQLKKDGIPGAQAGMLINTVSEQLFDGDEGVLFVPAFTEQCFVEWVPRKEGGGFVARHEVDSEVVKKAQAESTKFGKYRVGTNELIETFYLYGVICPEGEVPSPVVIAFTSTKIGVYKRFNSKLRLLTLADASGRRFQPPLFAHLTRIKTKEETNQSGSFYNFVLEPANGSVRESLLPKEDIRFQAAAEVRDMIKAGTKKVDYTRTVDGAGEGEAPVHAANTSSEKPPF